MAFALTFCPGFAWLILQYQKYATESQNLPLIGLDFAVWRLFLLVCSSLSGTVMLFLFMLPESPKFLLAHEKHDEALKILRDINRQNKKTESAFPVQIISLNELLLKKSTEPLSFCQQVWKQICPLFKPPLLSYTFQTSFIMFSLFAASSGFFMWTPDILNKFIDFRQENCTVCEVVEEVVRLKNL